MNIELVSFLTFWPHLNETEKLLLQQNAIVQKYEAKTTLHRGDNDCLGLVLIKKGQLRIYMLSPDGRDITLYRLSNGDVCILSATCVLETITFEVFIDVEQDSELITINPIILQQLVKQNIYVEAFSYKTATDRFSDVMWAMQQILFMSIDQRLALFLSEEVKKNNSLELKITHEQIAKYMGTAREVVTRMLKYFAQEDLVRISRGKIIIIDESKLKLFVKR